MSHQYKDKSYSSKKFPILERVFYKMLEEGKFTIGKNVSFSLRDVSDAYKYCEIIEPASISNTVLDLTRKDRGIEKRLPQSIIEKGYDIRKKTGPVGDGNSYCGEFVYVGVGNALHSWLKWDENRSEKVKIKNVIPPEILNYLSNDEGALFSAIDYCDILSQALFKEKGTVLRIQNPMKWQPNEIDGMYLWLKKNYLIAVEAKAVSTGDEINLEQMLGQYKTFKTKRPTTNVIPLAAVMVPHGIRLTVLNYENDKLVPTRYIDVNIIPNIESWKK